jgi:hypothetical protein
VPDYVFGAEPVQAAARAKLRRAHNNTAAPGQSVSIQRGAIAHLLRAGAELRPRATIPSNEARAVPRMRATLRGIRLSGAPPLPQRFWGTVCQCGETAYLILFINDRCLVLALSG